MRHGVVPANSTCFLILFCFILIGLSALVVLYSLINYEPAVNGNSIFWYAVGIILGQIFLLVGSIMYHIWLIRHAVEIAEMFGLGAYLLKWRNLTRKIEVLQKGNSDRYGPDFRHDTRNLVENMEAFKRDYPDSTANFDNTIPVDLATAINKVMGRRVVHIGGVGITK